MKKVVWLGDFDGQRANNFTAIRLLFALLVLFGHSFAVTNTGPDPLTPFLGGQVWIGALAVDGFFAISGFLVAGSYARQGFVGFAVSRALRIYPALAVCILLSTFLLGPLVTTLPLVDYLTHPQTTQYLGNLTLWPRVYHYLPGVFQDQPYSTGVNGSLWSLPVELRCYLLLLMAGFFGCLDRQYRASVLVLAVLIIGYMNYSSIPLVGEKASWLRPSGYFALGVFVWANRARIPLHPAIALLASMAPFLVMGTSYFHLVFAPSLVYLIFFCAYGLPHFDLDRLGDLSYGVYIYAWPVQQLMVWDGQNGYANAAISMPIVLALAALSWHLVEKTALQLRRPLVSILKWPAGHVQSRIAKWKAAPAQY